MPTIRRLYLYAVTLVSLEAVLWGIVGVLRAVLEGSQIGGEASRLAGAISLILVGLPVFLLHWWLTQRQALRDPDERFARLRAVFFYLGLLLTLVPVVQNLLALVSRVLLALVAEDPLAAVVGGGQTNLDNLVGLAVNALVAAYLFYVLRSDWQAGPFGDSYPEVRRLYRYLWLVYSLGLVVLGLQEVLQFILTGIQEAGIGPLAQFANGVALLLVGVPLWYLVERLIAPSLSDPAERQSLLRLVVFYLLSFVSVAGVLVSAAVVLYELLRLALGVTSSAIELFGNLAEPLSVAVPLAAVWVYYGRALLRAIRAQPSGEAAVENGETAALDQPRRAALRRLYFYILALFGLGSIFFGLYQLLQFGIDLLVGGESLAQPFLRDQLSAAVASLVVGAPLWFLAWRPLQKEAAQDGEVGDRARRSTVRKAYLFLVLFISVLGVMFAAGTLLYNLLRALLGDPPVDLALAAWQQLRTLALFALFLGYHLYIMRQDGRLAERSLARRHALYPVLVLAPEEGDFGATVANALLREAPGLPVAVHPYAQGAPDPSLAAARAVVLPAELLARPSEAMRLWLQGFNGPRLVIPTPAKGWHWLPGSGRSLPVLAEQVARAARHLAEGEEIPPPREASPWMIVVYILAALFALQLVIGLFGFGASLLLGGL